MSDLIYLGDVLSQLEGLRCSVPATLIGGIVDRGFSQNDIDLLCQDFSLSATKVREFLADDLAKYLHEVPEKEIGGEAAPPKLQIGSPRLWDFVQSQPFHSDEFINVSSRLCLSQLPLKGKRILDVGCGDGYALQWMKEAGAYPVGISTSKENLSKLCELGYEVYLMDQNCLDFEDESFDMVFSHHALEHSIAPALAVREACRVLKQARDGMRASGGMLDLTVGTGRNESHHYIFNLEFLRNLVEGVGFVVKGCEVRRPGLSGEIHVRASKAERAN